MVRCKALIVLNLFNTVQSRPLNLKKKKKKNKQTNNANDFFCFENSTKQMANCIKINILQGCAFHLKCRYEQHDNLMF